MTEFTADFAGKRHVVMRLGKLLGRGASGDIYKVLRRPGIVAKLYRTQADQKRYEAKIEDMIRRRPALEPIEFAGKEYPQIAWPTATLRDRTGNFVGFIMPEIDLKLATELENVLQKSARHSQRLPEFFGGRLLLAANLAALMAELHRLAHYFVDMKPMNLRFYPNAWYLAIIDTDGFSIQGAQRWPAHQYSQEYIAPEAQNLAPTQLGVEQDLFALAVIIFRLLNNGVHPFQGIDNTANLPTSLQERIFAGVYSYAQKGSIASQPARASIHEYLEPATRALFDRAFSGHPASRPTAREWSNHLKSLVTDKVFVKCKVNPDEHGHFSKGCGLCALEATRRLAASPAARTNTNYVQMSGAAVGAPTYSPPTRSTVSPPARSTASPPRRSSALSSGAQATLQSFAPKSTAQTPPALQSNATKSSAKYWTAIAFGALILGALIIAGKNNSSPSPQSQTQAKSTTAPASDTESLCRNALSANVFTASTMQEITWDTRPNFLWAADEARRRGYTLRSCAAAILKTLPPDRPSGNQPPRIASLSDRDLCKTALNAGRTGWDSRAEYLPYKQEADRRKLSLQQCQQLAISQEPAQAQRPGSTMPSIADKDVCKTALNASQTQWDSRPEYQSYQREAELRGLSVTQCRQLVGAIGGSTRQNAPASTDRLIISGLRFGYAIQTPNGSLSNKVERNVLPTTATWVAAWFDYAATTEKERLISVEIRQGPAVKTSCASFKASKASGSAYCYWQTLNLSPGAYRLVVSSAGEDLNATSFVVQSGPQR